MGLHRDPKNFSNPLEFNPNRDFRNPAFLPFGDGPRNCIAYRMGKIAVKVAVFTILSNFKVQAIEKKEIEFENYSVPLVPKGGVTVRVYR